MSPRTLIWSLALHFAAVATLHWTVGLDSLLDRTPVPVGILPSEASIESPRNRSKAPEAKLEIAPTPTAASEVQPQILTEPDLLPIDPKVFQDKARPVDPSLAFAETLEQSEHRSAWNESLKRPTEAAAESSNEPEEDPQPSADPSSASAQTRAKHHGTNRAPAYPARAREMRWEGAVVLEFQVDFRGDVANVDVLKAESCRYGMLKDAARKAVENWRFEPATLHGKPVDSWYCVRIVFRLTGVQVEGLPDRRKS